MLIKTDEDDKNVLTLEAETFLDKELLDRLVKTLNHGKGLDLLKYLYNGDNN